MFVTQFGDLVWNDPRALREWLAAHDLKHQALAQAAGLAGVQLPVFLLSYQIDDRWLQDHALQHQELSTLFVPTSTSSTYDLLNDPMSDQETFYNWHDLHNQLHQYLDQSFGITG